MKMFLYRQKDGKNKKRKATRKGGLFNNKEFTKTTY